MKNKKLIGLSLVVSAFTMLLTLFVAPASDKKTSRFLSALALIGGLIGVALACEQACCRLKKKQPALDDDDELFDEEDLDGAVEVIHAEEEGDDCATVLHSEVPCDEEATEAVFI